MNNTEEHIETAIEGHEGLIKTPKQLIVTVILAFIVPISIIVLLINLVEASSTMGSGSNAQTSEAIASRIKPVAGFSLVDANAPKVFKTGQQVFDTTCTACHTAGVAGAPKIGDAAAWAPFVKAGYEDMVKNAIHGINAMPPRGGNPSLSDLEVERAVVYIANKSGASFAEPAEPAAGADAKPAETAAAAPAAAPVAPAAAAPEAPKAVAATVPAAPAADTATIDPAGEKLYNAVCFACHTTGVANAPKLGDKEQWAKYIQTGMDAMLQNSIHGIGVMPPRGGSQATDAEMKAAIEYMVHAAK
ncbi:cytochrome c5 family protein [Alcaligenaceae bacterium]|nr:cytochrome c5 family protein [Alcaligenaceae bacterium]